MRVLRFVVVVIIVVVVPILHLSAKSALTIYVTEMHRYKSRITKCSRPV